MKIIEVANYVNMPGTVAKNGYFAAKLRKAGENSSWGGVDAMMKKDVKAIVSAYMRYVQKKCSKEMPAGDYEIVILEDNISFNEEIIQTIKVKIA